MHAPSKKCWCVGRGNAGSMEREENQRQVSLFSHRPLDSSHTSRPVHIPTALLRHGGKVKNQNQVSHFPTVARDDDTCSLSWRGKNPKKKSPLRGLTSSSFSGIPASRVSKTSRPYCQDKAISSSAAYISEPKRFPSCRLQRAGCPLACMASWLNTE